MTMILLSKQVYAVNAVNLLCFVQYRNGLTVIVLNWGFKLWEPL